MTDNEILQTLRIDLLKRINLALMDSVGDEYTTIERIKLKLIQLNIIDRGYDNG